MFSQPLTVLSPLPGALATRARSAPAARPAGFVAHTLQPAAQAAWRHLQQGWRDLFPAVPDADAAAPAPTAHAVVRYRHPHTGQGWTGHGPQPQWLRDALLREGLTVDALRQAARRG